jgi:hypothetical protein
VFKSIGNKTERKRALVKRRCKWDDNIKIDPEGIGWEYVDWIHLA